VEHGPAAFEAAKQGGSGTDIDAVAPELIGQVGLSDRGSFLLYRSRGQ